MHEAVVVLDEVMSADDKAVPRSILEAAEAIAVFPGMLKAGFVSAGNSAAVPISVRDSKTGAWSSPGFLTIAGGSLGLQIGARRSTWCWSCRTAAASTSCSRTSSRSAPTRRSLPARSAATPRPSTDIQMRAQILSYSRTRGIFAGVSLDGSTIQQDRDANERFYGTAYRTDADRERAPGRRARTDRARGRPRWPSTPAARPEAWSGTSG